MINWVEKIINVIFSLPAQNDQNDLYKTLSMFNILFYK
jgi:hypothetical protein